MPHRRTQITTAQTRGRPSPEQFLATFPPAIQALADQLRTLIKQTIPNVDEAVYVGWRLIGYRVREGRRSRYFCFVAPSPDRVALGFEYGVLLTNDTGLLEGDGTQVRYVTIRCAEDIRESELAALIAEAAMVAATFKRR
jgi:hypothetical protein